MEQPKTNTRGDVGNRKPSFTVGGMANWYSLYGNQYGEFSKGRNKVLSCPAVPLLDTCPKDSASWAADACSVTFTLLSSQQLGWKQPKCPTTNGKWIMKM